MTASQDELARLAREAAGLLPGLVRRPADGASRAVRRGRRSRAGGSAVSRRGVHHRRRAGLAGPGVPAVDCRGIAGRAALAGHPGGAGHGRPRARRGRDHRPGLGGQPVRGRRGRARGAARRRARRAGRPPHRLDLPGRRRGLRSRPGTGRPAGHRGVSRAALPCPGRPGGPGARRGAAGRGRGDPGVRPGRAARAALPGHGRPGHAAARRARRRDVRGARQAAHLHGFRPGADVRSRPPGSAVRSAGLPGPFRARRSAKRSWRPTFSWTPARVRRWRPSRPGAARCPRSAWRPGPAARPRRTRRRPCSPQGPSTPSARCWPGGLRGPSTPAGTVSSSPTRTRWPPPNWPARGAPAGGTGRRQGGPVRARGTRPRTPPGLSGRPGRGR